MNSANSLYETQAVVLLVLCRWVSRYGVPEGRYNFMFTGRAVQEEQLTR